LIYWALETSISGAQALSDKHVRAKRASKAKHGLAKAFPRLRIQVGDGLGLVLGPGKVDLLEAIERTGSISAAGREMKMSYRRAWLLVDALNHMFKDPLVTAATGGAHGGGAQLTDLGRAVAAAYRRAEERTRAAVREELGPFDPRIGRS
jgi:molybdate transport system regulatory protein